ncbi:MAG: hypothetical protein KBD78_03965 [Oligoflexales bacterium]|nr:hypothetical protein [Oligoflexales bacterium]
MRFNLNTYFIIGSFLISFSAAIGSYFKALADIRTEIQTSIISDSEKHRIENKQTYSSKEETQFIREMLVELKSDVKEIKRSLDKK